MPIPLAALIAGGAGSSIGAGLLGKSRSKKARKELQEATDFYRRQIEQAVSRGEITADQAAEAYNTMISHGGITPEMRDVLGGQEQFRAGIPGSFDPASVGLPEDLAFNEALSQQGMDLGLNAAARGGGTGESAGLREQMGRIINAQTREQVQAQELMDEIYGNRGRTQQTAQLQERMAEIIQAQGFTKDLQEASDLAMEILKEGGRTPETRAIMDQAMAGIKAGGRDAGTQALSEQGRAILASVGGPGGLTPEMRQALGPLLGIIGRGGRGGALMEFDQAMSLARGEAAQNVRGAREAGLRQALARGGGPGALLSSGLAGGAMLETGQREAEAVSGALRGTARTQQELQLTQLLGASREAGGIMETGARREVSLTAQGASLMTDAEKIAAQRLGIFSGMAGQAMETAAGRERMAAGLFGETQRTAAGRLDMATGRQLGAERAVLDRLGLAGDLGRYITGSRQAAGNTLLGVLGEERQRFVTGLDAVSRFNKLSSDVKLAYRQMVQNGRIAEANALLQSFGISAGVAGAGQRGILESATGLGNIARGYQGYDGQLSPNIATLARANAETYGQPSALERILAGIGQGAFTSVGQRIGAPPPPAPPGGDSGWGEFG